MPPLRKQSRVNRPARTPKRFKNGACVTPIVETPRGATASNSGASANRQTSDPLTISETTKHLSNKEKFDYLAGQMDKLMSVMTLLTNCVKGRNNNIVNNLSSNDEAEGEESEEEGEGREIVEGGCGIQNDYINTALFDIENQRYNALVSEINSVKKTVDDLKVAIDIFTNGGSHNKNASLDRNSHDRFKKYDEKIKHITDQMENDKQEIKTMVNDTKNEIKQTLSDFHNSGNIPRQIDNRQPQVPQQQQHDQQQQQQTIADAVPTTHCPSNTDLGNYSEHFLNRMRAFRSTNLIIYF